MKIIKGFVVIEQYVSNIFGTTSLLGELSTWSSTYAKDKGYYVDAVRTGYTLVTFKNVESISGVKDPVTSTQTSEILNIVHSMIQYSQARVRPHDPVDFRTTINNAHASITNTLMFGPLVDNGSVQLPEWFSYKSIPNGMAEIKIWLSDIAFKNQYDDYEITVVPPLLPLDNLFGFHSTVKEMVDARTDSSTVDQLQAAKNGSPETYARLYSFNMVNQLDPVQKHPVNWGVLVYGQAGDNIDIIKDAIIDFVLLNSSHTRSQWEALFPDLFKRTEFIMLPRWDKVSIPNLTSASELYSSILSPNECIQFFKNNINFYTATHIDNSIKILPYDYKAISILSVAGPTNSPSKSELNGLFPDYIPVSSLTTDFGRMQVNTRNWVVLMEQLLLAAETVTIYSSVPIGVRRINRGDVLFVSAVYDNINYMVACKSNLFYNV